MNSRRSCRLLAGLLAGLALGAVGCGVPTGGTVTTVDPAAVPYRLLDETPPVASAEPEDAVASSGPRAFYVTSRDRLVGVAVDLPPRKPPLLAAVAALSAGPDSEARGRRLRTAIPPGLSLTVTRVARDVATIELSGEQLEHASNQGPLAVAQIVLTATSVPPINRVLLTRQGQPLEAQLPDGGLTSAPLTAGAYHVLLAPSAR